MTPEVEARIAAAQRQARTAIAGMHRMDTLAGRFAAEADRLRARERILLEAVLRVAAGPCTGRRMPERECHVYPGDWPGCPACICRVAAEKLSQGTP